MRYDITALQVKAIAAMLQDEEDGVLLADMLEGETDLHPMVTRLLGWIESDEGSVISLKSQIEDRNERKRRFEARIENKRDAIKALLEIAGLPKLELPEATISVRAIAPKPIVSDDAAVPDELCRVRRSPDMALIKTAIETGEAVPGVTLDNGGTSLTIRRK